MLAIQIWRVLTLFIQRANLSSAAKELCAPNLRSWIRPWSVLHIIFCKVSNQRVYIRRFEFLLNSKYIVICVNSTNVCLKNSISNFKYARVFLTLCFKVIFYTNHGNLDTHPISKLNRWIGSLVRDVDIVVKLLKIACFVWTLIPPCNTWLFFQAGTLNLNVPLFIVNIFQQKNFWDQNQGSR